ncbi:TOM1-like protein 2 isoform X2 [Ylistrum balloti]|uniref:TOM1-like protein 2 isoform X2 n=1 Tax=Ylistrum balloti TaxID=509963 RepID=UPI002905C5DE|nr:TOM1-like protein 2 isoform X2 [Ylistrum balloti]
MAAIFGGNPLVTQIGQKIERATDGSQASENWGLFMEVCDMINESDDGPKDAIKAIKKRLSQNVGKNNVAIMYTLTCLETCVKNCGKRFHQHVANKDFLADMVKIIGPKYDPPQALQEKVLCLIQTWADAFRGIPELKEVEKVYQDLKTKGIEFPMTDLDSMAPIHTPARTHPDIDPGLNRMRPASSTRAPRVATGMPQGMPQGIAPGMSPVPIQTTMQPQMPPQPVQGTQTSGPINPTIDQMSKLKSELSVVQGNIRVMGEMLSELSPTNVDPSDLELLQELNRTNRQMQQRLVDLLDKIANEEITNELLRVNDDINNVFLRYERFEKYRTGQTGQQANQPGSQVSPEPSPQDSHLPPSYDQIVTGGPEQNSGGPRIGNLIDLGPENTSTGLSSQFSDMGLGAGSVSNTLGQLNSTATTNSTHPPSDDFDMFAQSRQSFDQNKKTVSGYSNQLEDHQYGGGLSQAVNAKVTPGLDDAEEVLKLQDRENDYDEMEQWLTDEQRKDLENTRSKPQESITSSEFDEFLAERAAAADTLPSISAQTGQQPRSANRNRQLKQKDEDENPLFAL